MQKLIHPGRIIFALGMLALGIICFIAQDFIVGRPTPWPQGFSLNPALAYISGTALILLSIAILVNKNAGLAALLIAGLIFLLSVLRTLPGFMTDWLNAYKALALLGGALVVACSFFEESSTTGWSANTRLQQLMVLVGSLFLGVFFIACGYAHFKFAAFVIDFIPAYIPFHAFWTYFCGVCLVAGGIGLIIPPTRSLAALLSAIMVLGWFVLLHIPRFITNPTDPSDRMGLCESFAFGGIFFVLAGISQRRKN